VKKIPYRSAIAMQPGVLEANRTQLVAAAARLRALRGEGAVVALVGIGASYYTATAAVREFWKVGVRAFAVDVGQLWEDDFDIADVYIAISASGESLETVAAVERLRKRKQGLVVSVTAELAACRRLPFSARPGSRTLRQRAWSSSGRPFRPCSRRC